MKFTAAGDMIIQQRICESFEGYSELAPFIAQGDARFFNLETTLNREGSCYASQFSGGTYLRTDPEVLDDLLEYGFNMTSFNNNHAMDFSYEGLLETFDYVRQSGLVQSGIGRNMGEAAAPNYLDTPSGRVALIAVNSTFNPAMMAGEQSRRVPGRPGINGLRFEETLVVSPEDFEKITEIGDRTGVNAYRNIVRSEGYGNAAADDIYELGNLRFQRGEETGMRTEVNKEDQNRVLKAIFEAQLQADYIIVSVHSHEISGVKKETPSQFLTEFSRACIDAGANAVIGHGPHLLRPIEIYKNRPIFYSIGDFILQLYSVAFAPEDFYKTQNMTSDDTVHALLAKRSKSFTRGLMTDPRMAQAVIPYWETDENGDLTKLELMPIEMSMSDTRAMEGLPIPAKDTSFMDRLAEMSAPYGTKIVAENGVYRCEW